jgi:hypothetical protein
VGREIDKADVCPRYESRLAAASEVWVQIDEVLVCSDRVIANTCSMRVRSNGSGPL